MSLALLESLEWTKLYLIFRTSEPIRVCLLLGRELHEHKRYALVKLKTIYTQNPRVEFEYSRTQPD